MTERQPEDNQTEDTRPGDTRPGFSVDQVDWPVVRHKASAVTATALCLITFMFVAGASIGTTRAGGALNVLFASLVSALPLAALVGVISVLWLMRRHRR